MTNVFDNKSIKRSKISEDSEEEEILRIGSRGTAKYRDDEEDADDDCHDDNDIDDNNDSDDNDNDNDNDNEEDEDEDDQELSSSTLMSELLSSWKQHTVAIMVALVSTFLSYYFQQRWRGTEHSAYLPMTAPTTLWYSKSKQERQRFEHKQRSHAHLEKYQRTVNLTFCPINIDLDEENVSSVADNNEALVFFDFNIPLELIEAMEIIYAADSQNDDTYINVITKNDDTTNLPSPIHNEQYRCLRKLIQTSVNSKKKYVKGYAQYYKSPEIGSMYRKSDENVGLTSVQASWNNKKNNDASRVVAAQLSFTGFASKFVNLSPKPILLYWDGRSGEDRRLVGEVAPFESLSTATTPGQSFSVSPIFDHTIELDRWVLTIDDAIIYYEPKNNKLTNPKDIQLYQMQLLNREFGKHYLIHAKRNWLSNFPRAFPIHFMWPASYFGQKHTIAIEKEVGDEEQKMEDYHYTLTVASISPRVFTIPNFLTDKECDNLLELALSHGLQGSTVYAGGSSQKKQHILSTRSSSNAWLQRTTATITDAIYRRAAHVLRIDESLLEAPIDDDIHPHHHSIAESLQVIRYKKSEEYTAHHDWVIPSQLHRYQPTRYATLLIYLNDDFTGGNTVFPRAVNSKYHDGIRIIPKKGAAVLFYNTLPDGNVDDLSQHSSEPVMEGVKYAANLWIWEPMIN